MRQDTCVLWLEKGLQGNKWLDLSKYHNDGVMTGAIWKESAIYFDGVDDYVNSGNHSSLDITGQMTLEMLLNLDKDFSPGGYLLSKRDVSDTGYYTYIDSNRQIILNGGSANVVNTGVYVPVSEWTHIVIVFDSTSAYTYINSEYKTTRTITAIASKPDMRPILSGRWDTYPAAVHHIYMKVALVRIFNNQLSSQQIKENYEQTYRLI